MCVIRATAPDDTYHQAMLDLIDEAGRDGRQQCLVLLQTMAAAGPIGPAEPARLAVHRLAGRIAADRGVTQIAMIGCTAVSPRSPPA